MQRLNGTQRDKKKEKNINKPKPTLEIRKQRINITKDMSVMQNVKTKMSTENTKGQS